jgi:biopolymer transport protein ExbD
MHPNYLDIMCCLVLVFLMTSLLADTSKHLQEQNLPPIALPELSANNSTAMSESKALILTVKPGPVYFAGEITVTLPALAAAIKSAQPAEVEIRGDAASPYLDVMNAMQACREAGVAQVALTYQVKEYNHAN